MPGWKFSGTQFPHLEHGDDEADFTGCVGTEMTEAHAWPRARPVQASTEAGGQGHTPPDGNSTAQWGTQCLLDVKSGVERPGGGLCPYQLPAAVRIRLVSTVSHSFPSRLHFKRLSFTPPTVVTSFSTSMYMEGSELTWGEAHFFSGDSGPTQPWLMGQAGCSGAPWLGEDREADSWLANRRVKAGGPTGQAGGPEVCMCSTQGRESAGSWFPSCHPCGGAENQYQN